MRGHVRKKKGNWYVVLELDRDELGARQQLSLSVRKELGLNKPATKRQAEELLVKKLNELNEGKLIQPSNMTLASYLERWVNDYCRPNLRQTTIDSYLAFIKNHITPTLGDIPIGNLKPAHLQNLYTAKFEVLSARSVKYIHTILAKSLKQAVRWELLHRNVAEAVSPPRERPQTKAAWDAVQAAQFLETAKEHRLYPLYLLALSTGLRRGEILGLRWRDIDLKVGTLSVRQTLTCTAAGNVFSEPKTDKARRSVALSPNVVEELKRYKLKQKETCLAIGIPLSELVFTSEVGTPLGPNNLLRNFKYLTAKAGLPVMPFHNLRHTHASLMLSAGVHPKIVSERLGHSRISTTMDIYSHVLPGLQEEAAAKFDTLLQTKGGNSEGT